MCNHGYECISIHSTRGNAQFECICSSKYNAVTLHVLFVLCIGGDFLNNIDPIKNDHELANVTEQQSSYKLCLRCNHGGSDLCTENIAIRCGFCLDDAASMVIDCFSLRTKLLQHP